MAGKKISQLPAVFSAQLTDIFPAVQSGVTVQLTLNQVLTLFGSGLPYLPLAGGTMSGTINMNTNKIIGVPDPIAPLDAANKEYVDMVAQGFIVQPAAYAATTGNLNTIYNNGAGVGATLTDNSGTFAAFSIDGVSPPLNSNILVKDQTNTFENGLYKLTTNGDTISIPYVLTRQTFYDQPSEILPGDFVLVNFGTVNSATAWIETATVTAVGTDPILFSKFGNAVSFPITLSEGGTNASLVASNGGIFYSTATAGAILSGTATANQLLMSSASSAPHWSTATYPATATGTGTILRADGTNWVPTTATYPDTTSINEILFSSSANVISQIATILNGVLTTNGSGIPSITSTILPANVPAIGSSGMSVIGNFTHDISLSGTQSITGVGFAPSLVIFLSAINGPPNSQGSIGYDNGSARACIYNANAVTTGNWGITVSYSIFIQGSGSNNNKALITAFGSDGFTLTWTKSGTPTGSSLMTYLAFK